ncbi:MAG: cobalamin-binding protein [Promethearchaeota archaeon]|nr:MAG: cobalamin-binding protein [Candidatus Lokiarchaeota archaeon]
MSEDLFNSLVDLREDHALKIVKERLNAGIDPYSILNTCRDAMVKIGDLFAKKEYFLSELVMSGEILKEIMEILEPHIIKGLEKDNKIGKIVIGTVKGDIHDLGKDIVVSMLKSSGFDVYDLGVDVPTEKFVEKVKEVGPDILGMSCVISIGWESLKETIDALKEEHLRDKLKIIIGGGGVDDEIAKYAGADKAVKDVMEGVNQCKRWVGA